MCVTITSNAFREHWGVNKPTSYAQAPIYNIPTKLITTAEMYVARTENRLVIFLTSLQPAILSNIMLSDTPY
jgi:hypothetical protein